jgi:hypothetical protein
MIKEFFIRLLLFIKLLCLPAIVVLAFFAVLWDLTKKGSKDEIHQNN